VAVVVSIEPVFCSKNLGSSATGWILCNVLSIVEEEVGRELPATNKCAIGGLGADPVVLEGKTKVSSSARCYRNQANYAQSSRRNQISK